MDNAIRNSVIRWVACWALQVMLFRYLSWGWNGQFYLQVHVYPIFILLLPFATPRILTIVLGFSLGIAIDWLYGTPGMHAGALVFTAYWRRPIINLLTPREGYNPKDSPTKASLGGTWFLRYMALLLFIHFSFYYLLEAFTIFYWLSILGKALVSTIGSMFFLLLYIYTVNPES